MAENKKYLDLDGLSHFWGKVKSYVDTANGLKVDKTTTVNNKPLSADVTLAGTDVMVGGTGAHKELTVAAAINTLKDAIDVAAAAGVVSFGGATGAISVDTEGTDVGNVKFKMTGQKLSGTVTGFGDLATKAGAVGSIKAIGSVTQAASNVAASVTITPVSVQGSDLTPATASITIPAAAEAVCGVVTLGTIKDLAAKAAGAAATSAYKVKGSKESLAAVLAVPSAVVGDVYNITAQFTLGSKPYPAGTNVVFIGHGESEGPDNPKLETQWDALGGTVDLSPYATTASLNSVRDNLSGQIGTVDGKVGDLTTTVTGHTTDITNLKTTTGAHTTDITNLKNVGETLGGRIDVLEAWKGEWARIKETEIDAIFNPKP